MNSSAPRLGLVPLAALVLGCLRPEERSLVVATTWSPAERAAIADGYREAHPSAPTIAWVPLMPVDDASRLVPGLAVDLVLGVPSAELDALAAGGRLVSIGEGERRPWRVVRRLALGLDAETSLANPSPSDRSLAGRVALDDARRDPLALAWARARLEALGWPGGYADLVRSAANARRIGPAGSGRARVARGDASVAPAADVVGPLDERTALVRLDGAPPWIEGVAIVAGTERLDDARSFVAFLAGRGQAGPVPDDIPTADPVVDGLLADLLGATLVDAQDELWTAVEALDLHAGPDPLRAFLDDPPPWPPTSIEALRVRPDADELIAALAREIAPEDDARAWLLRSWDRPASALDAGWFREVAAAADGRLAREPRFRAWLRGEWTAWARQHDRRIAREAGKAAP